MEQLIEELTENFKQSIPEGETKLIDAFKEYLLKVNDDLKNSDSKFVLKDEESISNVLRRITERLVRSDLRSKKRELLIDENFEKLSMLSGLAKVMAEDILNGKESNIKFDINEKIEEMTSLLDLVEEYNKEQASWLVSEGTLDFKFVENPETNIVSLRLNRIIQAKKARKENFDER